MLRLFPVGGVVLFLAMATPATAQSGGSAVDLEIGNGLVSLDARNATLREILLEWEQVGQTRIFNVDQIAGEPLSLRLDRVPEERALEILLRSLNGYLAAPRVTPDTGLSRFDRIMVMPGIARPRVAAAVAPAEPSGDELLMQAPAFPAMEEEPEERPVRIVPAPGQRGAAFRGLPPLADAPRPPPQQPPARPSYGPQPVAPQGVPVPGMIVPVPEESNQQEPDPSGP